MKYETHDFAKAAFLLKEHGLDAELAWILNNVILPIWVGKSMSQKDVFVVQSMLNTIIDILFTSCGWERQSKVHPDLDLILDFSKTVNGTRYVVEVQFANSARQSKDLNKFQIGWNRNTADVAIVVTLDESLAKVTDSNIAKFEGYAQEIADMGRAMYSIPTFVVGLVQGTDKVVDMKSFNLGTIKALTGKNSKNNREVLAHRILAHQHDESFRANHFCDMPMPKKAIRGRKKRLTTYNEDNSTAPSPITFLSKQSIDSARTTTFRHVVMQ